MDSGARAQRVEDVRNALVAAPEYEGAAAPKANGPHGKPGGRVT